MKIRDFKVQRLLDTTTLRKVCVENDYYTRGTSEEYDNLFKIIWDNKIVTDEQLIKVAEDIYNHSNIEKKMREYGCSDREVMDSIMFNLVNACYQLVEVEYE